MKGSAMTTNLRKGPSSVYVQHKGFGHSIGAEHFECSLVDGVAVVRFTFRPVDGNQRDDLETTFATAIESVDVDDSLIQEKLVQFVSVQKTEISGWRLEAIHQGRRISLSVSAHYRLGHLHFPTA